LVLIKEKANVPWLLTIYRWRIRKPLHHSRNRERRSLQQGNIASSMEKLTSITEGTPKVDTCEVVNSTFHKIAALR